MKYTMKSGALCAAGSDRVLARLKGGFLGPEKKIFTDEGQPALSTAIRKLPAPPERIGDARYREYVIFDGDGNEHAGYCWRLHRGGNAVHRPCRNRM